MARRKLSAKARRRLLRGLAVVAAIVIVPLVIIVLVLDRRVTAQFEGRRWTLPARVYAQPVELYVGQTLSAERCAQELDRLGYTRRRTRRSPEPTGDAATASMSTCARSASRTSCRRRARCELGFAATAIVTLEDAQGRDVPVYRLDPLLIGSIFPLHGEDRIVVAPDEVPPLLPAALKAVEDRKFDEHHGINLEGDPACAVRQRARRADRAGRQHADAAARQELLPRQPPHAAAQGRGSGDGHHSRSRASRRRTS